MKMNVSDKLGYQTLPVTDEGNNRYSVTMTVPGAYGIEVKCSFWRNDYEGVEIDPWRYQLDQFEPQNGETHYRGPFSHHDKKGCLIAIYKYMVNLGVIEVPTDNSHLDEIDAAIVAQMKLEWIERSYGRPSVGDFVQFADGSFKRCCNEVSAGQQVTTALEHSYFAGRLGSVNYSGGLESDIPWDQIIEKKGERIPGRFWFFHHNRSGAGRGVDFYMPCRVFSVIEAEADQ